MPGQSYSTNKWAHNPKARSKYPEPSPYYSCSATVLELNAFVRVEIPNLDFASPLAYRATNTAAHEYYMRLDTVLYYRQSNRFLCDTPPSLQASMRLKENTTLVNDDISRETEHNEEKSAQIDSLKSYFHASEIATRR